MKSIRITDRSHATASNRLLIRASLPCYFPERHGVWERVDAALDALCSELRLPLVVIDGVATDAAEARAALDICDAESADLVLLVHGGFTMGDVGREVATSRFPFSVIPCATIWY